MDIPLSNSSRLFIPQQQSSNNPVAKYGPTFAPPTSSQSKNDPLFRLWSSQCGLESRLYRFSKNIDRVPSHFKCILCSSPLFQLPYPLVRYPWSPLKAQIPDHSSPGTFLIPSNHISASSIKIEVLKVPKYVIRDATFAEVRYPIHCSTCSFEVGFAPSSVNIPYYRIYSFGVSDDAISWDPPTFTQVTTYLSKQHVKSSSPKSHTLSKDADKIVLCSVHHIPRKLKHCTFKKKHEDAVSVSLSESKYVYSCLPKYNCLKERKVVTGGQLSTAQEKQLSREMRISQHKNRLAHAARKMKKRAFNLDSSRLKNAKPPKKKKKKSRTPKASWL